MNNIINNNMKTFKNEIHSLFQNKFLLEEAIGYNKEKLTDFIVAKRKENIWNLSNISKEDLVRNGRCPKCTLIIPCKHYENPVSVEEIKKILPEQIETLYTDESFPQSPIIPMIYKDPSKEKKRLKVLDDIKTFREKKMNDELNLIKEQEVKKSQEEVTEKVKEIKRKRYLDNQKKKLRLYKEEKNNNGVSKSVKCNRIRKKSKECKFNSRMKEIDSMLLSQIASLY